jgi:hypothetical protein
MSGATVRHTRAQSLLSPMLSGNVEPRGCLPNETVIGIDEGEA